MCDYPIDRVAEHSDRDPARSLRAREESGGFPVPEGRALDPGDVARRPVRKLSSVSRVPRREVPQVGLCTAVGHSGLKTFLPMT